MNNTYTSNENCFLIEGEVYLGFVPEPNIFGESMYSRPMLINGKMYQITHSTKDLDNVVLLPRDKFVKPVNVEELAIQFAEKSDWIPWSQEGLAVECFKAGHNANPNSFTGEQLDEAISLAFKHGQSNVINEWQSFNEIRRHFAPKLSLPASLEINEQGEIVNVIW